MTPNLDKYPQALEPSLYIVVVAAGGAGAAHVEYYQSRIVAYTRDEAIQAVMRQMASEDTELHQRGIAMGGWRATHVEGMRAAELETMFTERADMERNKDRERIRMQQNSLLRQILENKDTTLLHQAIREGRISNYERLYLHELLTKDIDTKTV